MFVAENIQSGATHNELLGELWATGRLRRLLSRRGADFASNDYLGLAGSQRLASSVTAALGRGVPVGSGGSRLLRGNHPEHELLEEEAARFFRTETALYFSSGFAANTALLATLPQRGDVVAYDELIHASAHDGMKLGRADTVAVRHNDPDHLDAELRRWRRDGAKGRAWIAIESLYSMDGDFAPLDEFARIAQTFDAVLLIDEAHATGVFGPDGRGLGADFHERENVISLHTCGKALGCEGALVTGPAWVREFLINFGRGLIFSTAPSPLMASAVREALHILKDEPARRKRLADLVRNAHAALGRFANIAAASQILPIILGKDAEALRVAAAVQAAGYDVRAIRPPTVPVGTARLRVSITLNIDPDDLAGLANTIETALR